MCTRPWAGDTCGRMELLPVPPVEGYGFLPNHTTWGGNAVEWGGKWHLFAAQIINGCPLSQWESNSECAHAVADSPLGPFEYSDTAVPVWCHNPQVVKYTDAATGASMFALFHIGDGTPVDGKKPRNCSAASIEWDGRSPGQAPGSPMSFTGNLQTSSSPYGPWTSHAGPPNCNNPSPMRHRNGTWYVVCNNAQLMRAADVTGPWEVVVPYVHPQGGVTGTYEDAYLYMDTDARWHVLFHVYNSTTVRACTCQQPAWPRVGHVELCCSSPRCYSRLSQPCGACLGTLVSGHTFSADGLSWNVSSVSPYGNTVAVDNGSVLTLSTRERPKLVFNSQGQPTHLMNGVCYGVSSCPPTPGVNCKYDFAVATLTQPLRLA